MKSFNEFVNESYNENVNEESRAELEKSIQNVEAKLRQYKTKHPNTMHPFDPQKKMRDYVSYLETSLRNLKGELAQMDESKIEEGKIVKTETISHEIDYTIDRAVWSDTYDSEAQCAEMIADDLDLKIGKIVFTKKKITIEGENFEGSKIEVSQTGEFDMYGGQYTPKMDKPTVKVNGKDIYPQVRKEYSGYGWESGDEIDISRTDIWGHLAR